MAALVEHLSAADFAGNRLRRAGNYIVCFAAEWCSFCRSFLPQFALLEPHLSSTLAIAEVNDDASPLWAALGLEVVPMVAGYSEGSIRWRVDSMLGLGLGSRDLARIRELDTTPTASGAPHRGASGGRPRGPREGRQRPSEGRSAR